MYLQELITKLLNKQTRDSLPISVSDWPSEIRLPENFFKRCKELEELTREKTGWFVSKINNGSTGWEYSFTVYYAFGDFFYTKNVGGDYKSVMPIIDSPKDFKTIPDYKNNKVDVKFKLSNRNRGKQEWHDHEIKNIKLEKFNINDKNFDNRFIPVITSHSHPDIFADGKSVGHTFFSPEDLNFLLKSSVLILTMVSKNNIWLMCKTSNLIKSYDEIVSGLRECTFAEQQGIEVMKESIRKNLSNSGIAFYHSVYGGTARKI